MADKRTEVNRALSKRAGRSQVHDYAGDMAELTELEATLPSHHWSITYAKNGVVVTLWDLTNNLLGEGMEATEDAARADALAQWVRTLK